MILKALWSRLVVATLLPVTLVTGTLTPILTSHLDDHVDSKRLATEAILTSEYDKLLQGMNESFNQVLATAEYPLLRRFLAGPASSRGAEWVTSAQHDWAQLEALFETLLTHYGRYTRMAVIDTHGREWIATTQAPPPARPPVDHHDATSAFQGAMALRPRDLYISSPRLGTTREDGSTASPVIDIAAPIFDHQGERLGVLLFTLDWSRITASLSQTPLGDGAKVLLVDAQGTSLLPDGEARKRSRFGHSLASQWPAIWAAMAANQQGIITLDKYLLGLRTHDIRTHHYRSQAVTIVNDAETQPWHLGVLTPRPSLVSQLIKTPIQLLAIVLVYLLSVASSIFWVLSDHRLRGLRQRALAFSRKARQYAGEVQDLYEHAPCGYHSLDSDGRVIKINRTELDWLGYRGDDVIGKRYYRDFVTAETRAAFDAAFHRVLGQGKEGAAECELLCRDGSQLPVAIKATAHVTENGFQYSRAMVFDLSERKSLERRLERQALMDPLTGLGNRRYLENQATMEIARAKRNGAPLALIAIDLDHFKRINDAHGHDAGDLVLQSFANTAKQQLRAGDVLCRIGGEEFVVLLPDTSRDQALQIAQRLREAIAATPAEVGHATTGSETLAYSASMGVTLVSAGESTLRPAIKRADQGLYAAKEAGRNRVEWEEA